jgi:hypothetical protein
MPDGFVGKRESPGLFISERCADTLRTLPVLPRDQKDPDDVDTEAEDHIGDEIRYRCRHSAGNEIVIQRGGRVY